jgi:hypothetical protein
MMPYIDKATAFLESFGSENTFGATKRYNDNRSSLSKRFDGKTHTTAQGYQTQQLLTHKQEVRAFLLVCKLTKQMDKCRACFELATKPLRSSDSRQG